MTGMDTEETPGARPPAQLRHDEDRDRFEALVADRVVAVLSYEDTDLPATTGEGVPGAATQRVRDLRSTVVDPAHGGRGIGSALVRTVLDHSRENGLHVVATCWFVRGWIQRHPEYADLLASPQQAGTPHTDTEGPSR